MSNENNYNAPDFYNNISGSYDEMFKFADDLTAGEKLVVGLKNRFEFKKVLDIGCGTGSIALALARSGVECTAIDLSPGMIAEARKNTAECAELIKFINSGIGDMSKRVEGKFDLIICVGNTVPHLLDVKSLDAMLADCGKLLNPGGHLVLNLLNYDRILDEKDRIVGITRTGNKEFIRFYDFEKPFVKFNLLEIDWSGKYPLHKLVVTKLYPYRLQELKSALNKAAFSDVKTYDGFIFGEYSMEKTKSIMLVASKP